MVRRRNNNVHLLCVPFVITVFIEDTTGSQLQDNRSVANVAAKAKLRCGVENTANVSKVVLVN